MQSADNKEEQKTAMQELIDGLDPLINDPIFELYHKGLIMAQQRATSLLNKEKQQIIDTMNEGVATGLTNTIIGGEQYFTQTFNQ